MKLLAITFFVLGLMTTAFRQEQSVQTRSYPASFQADTLEKDPETNLIMDENTMMVKAQCTNCHSSKLIIQNRFTRNGWQQKIRWMQANHNLWDLGETEKQVLDYLEKNYGPTQSTSRRQPLKDIKWRPVE